MISSATYFLHSVDPTKMPVTAATTCHITGLGALVTIFNVSNNRAWLLRLTS